MRFDLLPFSPQIIRAAWAFGKLPSEDAPRLAQEALALGFDGKYTRRIAGLIAPNHFDLEPLMGGFLAELGVQTNLAKREAGLSLAAHVSKAIAEGLIAPYEGARFIWREIVNELWPSPPESLMAFVSNASEYEDCDYYAEFCAEHPDEVRRKIEQDIIEDARALAATQDTLR